MRVLEARFHTLGRSGTAQTIVVGRVLCGVRSALLEPAPPMPGLSEADRQALLDKLRFLIQSSLPRPGKRLLGLRSDFWSFAEIDPANPPNQAHKG